MTEQWRPIPGYDDRYEVSDLGQVRSLRRLRDGRPIVLAWWLNSRGYRYVTLNRGGGISGGISVHRLVLMAFVGPRPAPDIEIRHLDGDNQNNALSNLAYGTRRENQMDIIRHGRHPEAKKTHCPAGHPYDEINTRRDRHGHRHCRPCAAREQRERRAARRTNVTGSERLSA